MKIDSNYYTFLSLQKTKTLFLQFILLLCLIAPTSQLDAQLYWQNSFGSTASDRNPTVIQTATDDFYLTYSAQPEGTFDDVIQLVKTDDQGQLLWDKNLGLGSAIDMVEIAGQGFAILATGSFPDPNFILFTDYDGNLISNNIDVTATEFSNDLALDGDGNLLVSGYILADSLQYPDFGLVKYDLAGNEIFARNYGSEPNVVDLASSVLPTSDGGYLLMGMIQAGNINAFAVRTDAAGNVLWELEHETNGSPYESFDSAVETSDGGFIFAGFAAQNLLETAITKVDANGNVIYSLLYGESGFTPDNDNLILMPDGGLFFTGQQANAIDSTRSDIVTFRTDANGTVIWSEVIESFGNNNFTANHAILTNDNHFAIAGTRINATYNDSFIELFKLANQDFADLTCINDFQLFTQADVDAFTACDTIYGNLVVGGSPNSGIIDISNLQSIKVVTGDLVFLNLEIPITGFNNLTEVGSLIFPQGDYPIIDGFNNITEVGYMYINSNELTSITGFNSLTSAGTLNIEGAPNLTTINAFDNLTSLVNTSVVSTNLTNLDHLASVVGVIDGSVVIAANPLLENVDGLINITSGGVLDLANNNPFVIASNAILTNVDGLANLTTVNNLYVQNNPLLEDVSGLANVTTVNGDFDFTNNPNVFDCCPVADLIGGTNVLGSVTFMNNGCGSNTGVIEDSCGVDDCAEDVYLSTQAEVDAWIGCTRVEGTLTITGNDIVDLSPLSTLTSANNLYIVQNPNLTNLNGLQNIVTVDGSFVIVNNESLNSVQGLNGMTSIAGFFYIYENDALTTLDGFDNLQTVSNIYLDHNDNLADITAFSSITSPINSLQVFHSSLTSLDGLENIADIESTIIIVGNKSLADISQLSFLTSASSVFVLSANNLQSLNGLENLTSVSQFYISVDSTLTSLDGLENLTTVESLGIEGNSELTDCCALYPFLVANPNANAGFADNTQGCNSVQEIIQNCQPVTCNSENIYLNSQADVDAWLGCTDVRVLHITGNDITDLSPLSSLQSADVLLIRNNPNLTSLAGLENLTTVDTSLHITDNAITDLQGINGLTGSIQGFVTLSRNSNLTSLTGLENVNQVGTLVVSNNPLMTNVDGLSGLTNITEGFLHMMSNDALANIDGLSNLTNVESQILLLTNPALANVDGLVGLTSTNEELVISFSGLENVDGLSNLTNVERIIITGNELLTNLDGLSNLTTADVLEITDNALLTDCCGIYPILNSNGVASTILIEDNPAPCSSQSDIFDECNNSNTGGNIQGVDLELSISANYDTYQQYSDVIYTIELTNAGTERTDDIRVNIPQSGFMGTGDFAYTWHDFAGAAINRSNFAPYSGDWNLAYLEPGESATLELVLYVLAEDGDPLTVFAQVMSSFPSDMDATAANDTNGSPNEDDEAAITIYDISNVPNDATEYADIEVYASVNQTYVNENDEVTFEITVFNRGAANATNLVLEGNNGNNTFTQISDLVTQGTYDDGTETWAIGDLAVGQTAMLTITVKVGTNLYAFANWQIIAADQRDPDSAPINGYAAPGHEDDEALIRLYPADLGPVAGSTGVDLALDLAVDDTEYTLNDYVTYTLTVTNEGDTEATGVQIDWQVPEGMAHHEAIVSQGEYYSWAGEWFLGAGLPAGESATIEFTVWTNVENISITSYAQVIALNESDADSNAGNGTCCTANEDDEAAITIGSDSFTNPQMRTTHKGSRQIEIHKVYPTVATDRVSLSINNTKEELTFSIYNSNGQEVMIRNFNNVKGHNILDIDVADLPTGMYFVRFHIGGSHEPVKFVKQRM